MTYEERREVTERLRALEVPSRAKRMEHPERTAAWYELLCGAVGGKRDPWFGIKALADRLADLIDPGESGQNPDKNLDSVQIESPAVKKAPECDREALLALAEEMEGSCDLSPVRRWALCIREACGEVVG